MVARNKNENEVGMDARLSDRRRRDLALEIQRDVQKQFLLDQLEELSADFAGNPEQIGVYLADLEASGMLTPADKGMVFRRLWETMGPSFADRAFGMTDRALSSSEDLASDIANDAYVNVVGDRAVFSDEGEFARAREATVALEALASALGLKLDVPRPELRKRPQFDNISDADSERAQKTHEVLDSLGRGLGVDASRVDVRVDETASQRTADAGIWGLMTDGTVYLDPEIYDPETSEGKHLLAHEMIHVAQLENRLRGANDAPDLFAAEAEADTLSATFAETGSVQAPLATLASYDQAACGPREMTTPKEPRKEVEREPGTEETKENVEEIRLEGSIYFAVDKDTLAGSQTGKRPQNEQVIARVTETMKKYPEIKLVDVRGHTSTTATAAYNRALSVRRATNMKAEVVKGKVAAGRLNPLFFGEDEHRGATGITDDKTQVEDGAFRRVDFKIAQADGDFDPATGVIRKVTKEVIKKPGRTIIKYYDAEGKLERTEVIVDGEDNPEVIQNDPQATPPSTATPTPSTTTTSEEVEHTGTTPGGTSGPTNPGTVPVPQRPAATDSLRFRTKVKPNKRKGARAPRRFAENSLRTVAQPKAAPGGLTSTQIDQTTRTSGGGEPIPDSVRGRFEQAFGQDFGDVRIHRGSTQATGIGATAFARGTDIHFAPGRFDADSSSGLAVLGHELTHIVQQRAGRVSVPQGMGTHVNVERALEAEADILGSRAARGESVSVQGSSAALYSRAARGGADTIQYEGGEGATEGSGGTRPTHCELRIGGQRIRARMPASPAAAGEVRVDFSEAVSIPGLQLKTARVTFNSNWEIESGSIVASVAVGEYVKADDVTLSIEKKEDATGKYAEVAAEVRGAQFKIDGLFDSTIDLRLSNRGVTGRASIEATAPITLGEGITLTGGSLVLELREGGAISASGRLLGDVSAGGVNLGIEITADAMTEGHVGGSATIRLQNPVPVPGVEGVTIKSGNITGRYVHGQSWTLEGGLTVNVRDWVEASITGKYTQNVGGGEGGGGAASSWELTGSLRQLQPYTVPGTEADPITLSNGELDLHFKDGQFLKVDAKASWDTTNFKGDITGTFDVPNTKLDAVGTVDLKPAELPIGDTGAKFTAIKAAVILKANELEKITGNVTVVFPYQDQPTFKLEGTDIFYMVKDQKVTGTATVTTLRALEFGDKAAYNASVKEGATGQLSVADNKLLGITGGLAFDVNFGASKIGDGTLDVNFEGETSKLNATAKFTLTAEEGFGVPDRVAGPVMLLPGGQFQLTIEGSELGEASIRGVKFEVKQAGEGATGKIAGELNGNYSFKTSKLTATGNAELKGNWPLTPVQGVTLTFKEGGRLDVAVTDSVLTRVNGEFQYEAHIAPQGSIPEIKLEGTLNGDYSDETKKFGGELTGELKSDVNIPVNADQITVKSGSKFGATVVDSAPGKFTVSFDADYTRKGELFLSGHVENATYDFTKGHFGFQADLTLKALIEKQTEDGKWKFVVQPNTQVGVKVEESKLKMLTGRILFQIHDSEGALLDGALTDAEVDVEKLEFSGKLDVSLARDIKYPRSPSGGEQAPEGSPPVQAVARKSTSKVWGVVTKNQFAEIGAKLDFGINLAGTEYGAGELTGTLDMKQFEFDGTGKITLVKDFILGGDERNAEGDPIASWFLCFPAGQGLDMKVTKNQLDEANINLNGKLLHNLEEVANGAVTGAYKLGDTKGFNGSITANVIKDLDWSKDDRFHYWIETGTTFKAELESNAIKGANGNFKLRLDEFSGGTGQVKVAATADYRPGVGIDGGGSVKVTQALCVKEGGEWKLFIDAGSGGEATVKASRVTELGGTLKLNVTKNADQFATGDFSASYKLADGRNAIVDATGSVSLLGRQEVTPPGAGEFKVYLTGGTGIAASVKNSELEWIDGQVKGDLHWKGAELAVFDLTAKYVATGTPDLTGSGKFATTKAVQVTEFQGYKLFLGVGANVTGSVKAFALDELTAGIPLELHKTAGTPLVKAELTGRYTHADKKFDGTGTAEVVKRMTIAEGVGSKGYSFYLEPSTGVTANIKANALDQIKGTLVVIVSDSPSPDTAFLKATATATYTGGEAPSVDADGKLEVTRPKEMLTSANGFKLLLQKGSNATINVAKNELKSIGGTIETEVVKDGTFAKISLTGTYTPEAGFSGKGTAELCQEWEVNSTKIGEDTYSVWVVKGTGAEITLANSDIKHIGGTVKGMIRDAPNSGGNFIQVEATANYDYPGKNFSGEGSITVLKPKKLATFSGEELWLAEGSGATGSVANNNLQRVGGNLNLHLKDATIGHWLTCALTGGFDAEGGTGFSGKGTVTVHKDKKLAELAGYKFVLAEGAGASATIAKNQLTEVTGQVPFKVYDEKAEPLLQGRAEGRYDSTTKKFSGTGEVYLGRDVEFPIGGGKLVFKTGSGGSGKVVDNELNELSGTLKVEVHDSTGPMIGLEANGKFNAVTKTLERVEGSAKLLRPISIGGEGENAFIRIDALQGSALVENNELKKLEGSLDITLPKLNNMKGHFEGGWQKTASEDLFWGKGSIEFTLFKDEAKGRSVSGTVEGEYRKDKTFTVKGEVKYQLNDMIGGKLGVEVDQTLDPKLSGTLDVKNVTLVQGRDLFKWSKDFSLLRTQIQAGPVPIAMQGGVGVGLGLSMRPLTFNASIGISNFKPLSAGTQVPDFSARAEMNTGLRFAASLKPWFSVGVGVAGVASAGLALQGEAGVNVDVNVSPYAELKGIGGVYSGNLGIGLEIVGSGFLQLTPQIYAELIGKKWPYDLATIRHELGNLFSYSYNFGVPFGDSPGAPAEGGGGAAKQTAAAAQTTKIAGHKTPPAKDPATTGAPNRPGPVKGGPDLNAANSDSKESAKRDGPMGELMGKIDQVQDWAAKVGAIANVGGTLVSALMFMVTIPPPFGFAVAGAYLAYKILSGSLTWEMITTAAKTVWELISSIDLSAITKLLPEWLVNLWNNIKGKSWDQVLTDMIDTMSDWLTDTFPSAGRVIRALANVAKTVIQTIARVIRSIMSGSFGLDDFLDICRSVGGAVLEAVLALVGDAIVEGVQNVGRAVGDFVSNLW